MFNKYTNSFLDDFSLNEILSKFLNKEFRSFREGTFIYSENEKVSEIHFIISGKVQIRKKCNSGYKILYCIEAGDLIGVDHALTDDHYSNSAYVVKKTNTISVSKKEFCEIVKHNDEFSHWILKYLSCKINSLC